MATTKELADLITSIHRERGKFSAHLLDAAQTGTLAPTLEEMRGAYEFDLIKRAIAGLVGLGAGKIVGLPGGRSLMAEFPDRKVPVFIPLDHLETHREWFESRAVDRMILAALKKGQIDPRNYSPSLADLQGRAKRYGGRYAEVRDNVFRRAKVRMVKQHVYAVDRKTVITIGLLSQPGMAPEVDGTHLLLAEGESLDNPEVREYLDRRISLVAPRSGLTHNHKRRTQP